VYLVCVCVFWCECVRLFLASGVATKIYPSKVSTFAQSNEEKWNGWLKHTHTHTHTHTHIHTHTQPAVASQVCLKED